MDDPEQTQTRTGAAAQLAYSMGKLSGEVAGHSAELQAQRQTLEDLPSKVADQLIPRFVAIETQAADHGRRIGSLEQWQWRVAGGVVVVGFLVPNYEKLIALFKLIPPHA